MPASKILSIADIAADPHCAARAMIRHIQVADRTELNVPVVVHRLSATPGDFTAAARPWASLPIRVARSRPRRPRDHAPAHSRRDRLTRVSPAPAAVITVLQAARRPVPALRSASFRPNAESAPAHAAPGRCGRPRPRRRSSRTPPSL
ncbi:MAG: hypothetical protein GZ089_11900, partial [Aromatoleum sp.]|nr:hypothetical protein [Aromatoleum sp.]